ncbi:MAG TPA: hypothetical protein VJH22_00450 [Candidatus Nanoarchaeia archaeon]|nr:hypothetical protein [Candidatus Nanoarchaeia archaeon]
MVTTDQLLEIVKRRGPVVPSDVSKEINQNLMFTSAMLSELSARKQVKVSHLKVGGGSPLYYTPDQQKELIRFLRHLDPKEQEIVRKLEQAKVLRDIDLGPLQRVALRQTKDFAVPLEVQMGVETEIFWKYFMTSDDEAIPMIKCIVEPPKPAVQEQVPPRVQAPEPRAQPSVPVVQEQKHNNTKQTVLKEQEQQNNSQEPVPQPKTRAPRSKAPKDDGPSAFFTQISRYFESNNIQMLENKTIRRDKEYEFTLNVPSPVGQVTFHAIAKRKKSLNESDLSTLYVTAQSLHLPILVITDGEVSKKAESLVGKELRNLSVVCLNGS